MALRGAHEALDLRARVVGGHRGERVHVHAVAEQVGGTRARGVDVEDLAPAAKIGEPDFHLQFQPPGPQHRGVQQVPPVRDAHHKHVIQALHPVQLREQLVHDVVVHHRRRRAARAARLHDGVDLVEDDDVQTALVALSLELLLRGREQVAHVLLGLPHEPLQNLRAVHDFGGVRVEQPPKLFRDESLPRSRRPVQQHAFHVPHAQFLDDFRRDHPAGEHAPEDGQKLVVQTADAVLLEAPVAQHVLQVLLARARRGVLRVFAIGRLRHSVSIPRGAGARAVGSRHVRGARRGGFHDRGLRLGLLVRSSHCRIAPAADANADWRAENRGGALERLRGGFSGTNVVFFGSGGHVGCARRPPLATRAAGVPAGGDGVRIREHLFAGGLARLCRALRLELAFQGGLGVDEPGAARAVGG